MRLLELRAIEMGAIVGDFQRKFGKFAFAMKRELNMAEFWDFLP